MRGANASGPEAYRSYLGAYMILIATLHYIVVQVKLCAAETHVLAGQIRILSEVG